VFDIFAKKDTFQKIVCEVIHLESYWQIQSPVRKANRTPRVVTMSDSVALDMNLPIDELVAQIELLLVYLPYVTLAFDTQSRQPAAYPNFSPR